MDFVLFVRQGLQNIKTISKQSEVHVICDRMINLLKISSYEEYLNKLLKQQQVIEHLEYQCNYMKLIKGNDSIYNILIASEEETYRLSRRVQELEQWNINLMKQVNSYDNCLNKNQEEQIYHLDKIKQQSLELVQLNIKLQEKENLLSSVSQLKKHLRLLESRK